MRFFALMLCLLVLSSCSGMNGQEACSIYTYSNRPGGKVIGSVDLDEQFAKKLKGMLPDAERNAPICWYTADGRIFAEIEEAQHDGWQGKSYEFALADGQWELVRTGSTITTP